jgi:hypothetical protein
MRVRPRTVLDRSNTGIPVSNSAGSMNIYPCWSAFYWQIPTKCVFMDLLFWELIVDRKCPDGLIMFTNTGSGYVKSVQYKLRVSHSSHVCNIVNIETKHLIHSVTCTCRPEGSTEENHPLPGGVPVDALPWQRARAQQWEELPFLSAVVPRQRWQCFL